MGQHGTYRQSELPAKDLEPVARSFGRASREGIGACSRISTLHRHYIDMCYNLHNGSYGISSSLRVAEGLTCSDSLTSPNRALNLAQLHTYLHTFCRKEVSVPTPRPQATSPGQQMHGTSKSSLVDKKATCQVAATSPASLFWFVAN